MPDRAALEPLLVHVNFLHCVPWGAYRSSARFAATCFHPSIALISI